MRRLDWLRQYRLCSMKLRHTSKLILIKIKFVAELLLMFPQEAVIHVISFSNMLIISNDWCPPRILNFVGLGLLDVLDFILKSTQNNFPLSTTVLFEKSYFPFFFFFARKWHLLIFPPLYISEDIVLDYIHLFLCIYFILFIIITLIKHRHKHSSLGNPGQISEIIQYYITSFNSKMLPHTVDLKDKIKQMVVFAA